MTWLNTHQVAEMVGGQVHGSPIHINGVSTDSRSVKKDELFIALKGERFDAHDFVKGIAEHAAAALVHQRIDCGLPQILVNDTLAALGQLAKEWRNVFRKPVIGLTGSNGKTTVKEMLSAILTLEGNVLSTLGNLNNDIGMPLTLLRLREQHDFAVIEMGANHFGEIDYLSSISQPDIAILNNAGAAHLEGFGSIKGVSRAKGEIFGGLRPGGVAVINADDQYADYWRGLNKYRETITFGLDSKADVTGKLLANGQLEVHYQGDSASVNLKLLGRHNALNALAATAGVVGLGVSLASVKEGLETLNPVKGRLTRLKGNNKSTFVDDTYNANPTSTARAVDVLASMSGRKIMVLGDMAELGENQQGFHNEIGEYARKQGIHHLFTLGELSRDACAAFGEASKAFDHVDELIKTLHNYTDEQTTVLVKGSRSMRMERVIEAFVVNDSETGRTV